MDLQKKRERASGATWMGLVAILVLGRAPRSAAFAAPKPAASPFGGFLDSLFPPADGRNLKNELKQVLLIECRTRETSRATQRERIEEIIDQLAPLSPTPAAASSRLLQNNWILEWTTEKEINFFSDWGISGEISQQITGSVLKNLIEFRRGGFLSVMGTLDIPDQDGVRTNFKFDTATLDLGKWASFMLPPVGEGWFDTIYLDEDLRIDTNSRDDILICTPDNF